MANLKKYVPLSIAFLVGVVLTQTISFIYAQEAGEIIHGCVRPAGLLRIIDENGTCNPNETPLNWQPFPKAGTEFPLFISSGGASDTDYFAGKDFRNAYISGSQFDNTDFTGTNFSGANIGSNSFTNVNFSNANVSNAINFAGGFINVNMSGITAVNTHISPGSEFTTVNLTNANLTNADFSNVFFTDCNLTGAITSGTNFSGTTWSNTICPDGTNSDTNGNTCEGHLTP